MYTCVKRITRKLNIHVTCYMQYTCNNDWTCTLQCTVLCMSNVYIYTKNRSLKTCTFKEVNVHLILLKSHSFDHTRWKRQYTGLHMRCFLREVKWSFCREMKKNTVLYISYILYLHPLWSSLYTHLIMHVIQRRTSTLYMYFTNLCH